MFRPLLQSLAPFDGYTYDATGFYDFVELGLVLKVDPVQLEFSTCRHMDMLAYF